jgi:hypothetical protein
MSAKLSSVRKRLAKLEQEQADRARREELADCNCPELKSAVSFLAVCPGQFEGEINTKCPVHGFRRFGEIVVMDFGTEESTKLSQLVEEYELRLAQHSQSSVEPEEENDSQES